MTPVDLQAKVLALESDLSGAKKELATRFLALSPIGNTLLATLFE